MVEGRGGGQVGRGGRSTERGGSSTAPPAGEKTEAEKVKSDTPRIRSSYRYRNYDVAAPPTFAKRESERYRRGCAASSSAASSSSASSSRQRPPMALVLKMEVEPEPPRLYHFAEGDYLDDDEFKKLLPQLGVNVGLAPGDFVAERELDTAVGLVARSSQQDADKAEEWRHIAIEQDRVFVDLVSDEE
ncbi:hypothetical protein ACQ4PT_042559 [Festuca glaucescens]